jgi:hypothetical protein
MFHPEWGVFLLKDMIYRYSRVKLSVRGDGAALVTVTQTHMPAVLDHV